MSKLAFTKLNLKKTDETKKIKINDQEITIIQYLPVNDKLDLIARVIAESYDEENNFPNPIKIDVIGTIEIIRTYTNISFTDKQLEKIDKLYDLFDENGITDQIIAEIPKDEYNFLIKGIDDTIKAFYDYRCSVLGILDTMSTDYANLDLTASKIQEKLADKDNLTLVKDVLEKLG